jgi:hypothetical protein
MLTISGTLTKLESKPWKTKKGEDAETVTAFIQEHGYSERVEVDYRLDKTLLEAYIGKAISGPVRVFRNYDEATRRMFVRVVLMGIDPDSRSVAA